MSWFSTLCGFPEITPDQVRSNLVLRGETLTSIPNGRSWACGCLEIPALAELRQSVFGYASAPNTVRELVANVRHLHTDLTNAGAFFQVASQFNLLEMTSPSVAPERGIGIYEHDQTQGPACAIACGAGTIYRNYLVPLVGQIGQTAELQIDCLADLGVALGNDANRLWRMTNGYALPTREALEEIGQRLSSASERECDQLRQRLRIGIQWNTQVTLAESGHRVTQGYCSALPVAYGRHPLALWERFARLILEAAYEATLCAAIRNANQTGNRTVFLTLLGGGAFGNAKDWIVAAIVRALDLYFNSGLDIAIVSYGASKPEVREIVVRYSG